MNEVTKSIIRTVIEQAINRYDNSRNKEEIIDELSSVFETSTQYYEEHWEEKEVEVVNEHLSLKIEEVDGFSTRTLNVLTWLNTFPDSRIETLEDLVQYSQQKLLRYKNVGRKTVNEIKNVLSEMGLTLAGINFVMR